ncbi:MAG: low molecular weight protein-tyrosine-phosphatase [Longimicrobiales bacterium]|nr:low molecular weight protein-tyrosine-phosphatase [Longimicrobiales bacterium]
MAAAPTSVLFVCLGNICRSPLAEGIFRHLVTDAGLEASFSIDSAGTGAWHAGEGPDPRSVEVAAAHGVELSGRARQVTPDDLRRFDVVVAMDRDNLVALKDLSGEAHGTARLHLLRAFDPEADGDEVPDPYYGGPSGFEEVYGMVRSGCEGLLGALRAGS